MAAKRLAKGERLLDVRAAEGIEGYEVHTQLDGEARRSLLADIPPANYVEALPAQNGEVRVSGLVEKLFRRLRAQRST